jgi:hypothetical protein
MIETGAASALGARVLKQRFDADCAYGECRRSGAANLANEICVVLWESGVIALNGSFPHNVFSWLTGLSVVSESDGGLLMATAVWCSGPLFYHIAFAKDMFF